MNKIGCRCYICDHFNEVGGDVRDFPCPDLCIECYSAISSAFVSEPEEEDTGILPTSQPLNARPKPTSGQETTIQKETIVVEEDSTGTRTLPEVRV